MRLLITHAKNASAYKIMQDLNADFTLLIDQTDLPNLQNSKFKTLAFAYQTESLVHQILALCLDYDINCICPLQTFERQALESNKILFEEYGIQIIEPTI